MTKYFTMWEDLEGGGDDQTLIISCSRCKRGHFVAIYIVCVSAGVRVCCMYNIMYVWMCVRIMCVRACVYTVFKTLCVCVRMRVCMHMMHL